MVEPRHEPLHAAEKQTVRAFMLRERRPRWLQDLSSPRRRAKIVDSLNHCRDFEMRFVTECTNRHEVLPKLRALGAPAICHIISCADKLDGRDLALEEALERTESLAWGTLISCIPGSLAFYLDELGSRRWILHR